MAWGLAFFYNVCYSKGIELQPRRCVMSQNVFTDYNKGLRSARNGGCEDFSEKTADFLAGYRVGEKENCQIAEEEVAGMQNDELCATWVRVCEDEELPERPGVSAERWFILVFDQMCERNLPVVMAEA